MSPLGTRICWIALCGPEVLVEDVLSILDGRMPLRCSILFVVGEYLDTASEADSLSQRPRSVYIGPLSIGGFHEFEFLKAVFADFLCRSELEEELPDS